MMTASREAALGRNVGSARQAFGVAPRWSFACSSCGHPEPGADFASLCPVCGQPLFVRYPHPLPGREAIEPRWDMWRYRALMPIGEREEPLSLGEGCTPLTEVPALARRIGAGRLLLKNEAVSPTTSFKARGMSAALTRVRHMGFPGLVVPTNGNAGVALAAYAAAAGIPARVYAPEATSRPIQEQVRAHGAELCLVRGHIGDAGAAARAFAAESGFVDISTLREPWRLEGKKTIGIELAEQLGWRLPDAVVFPTGGGIAIIGMWKAFAELREAGWIDADAPLPRMYVVQAVGCAPLVRAFHEGADRSTPWEAPHTHASGLRVPSPLGDRLVLRALRESGGDAIAVGEADITAGARALAESAGVDACPEGGCAFAGLADLLRTERIPSDAEVVVFNTGSGAVYRA
jgi:threonine synthase